MSTPFQRCLNEMKGRGIPESFAYEYCAKNRPEGMTDEDRAIQQAYQTIKSEKDKAPTFTHGSSLKTEDVDEVLPLFIILGHKYPHVEKFYQNFFKFCVDLAKAGRTSWVGSWMSHKLVCMLLERFGMLWLNGAFSYDQGLSWAFGIIAGTEYLSDIQVSDIIVAMKGK